MSIIQTIDFNSNLLVRQVEDSFRLLLRDNRSIIDTLLANWAWYATGTNQKYEWLESQLSPNTFVVNGAVTLAAGTQNMTFISTDGMQAGMNLTFKTPAGRDVEWAAGETIAVYVVSITSATVAVVAPLPGTLATWVVPTLSVASFTKPVQENKKSFAWENTRQPVLEHNAFQIFDRQVELSDTVLNSLMYGDPNFTSSQLEQAMYLLMQDMQNAVSGWVRVLRGTTIAPGVVSKGSLGWYRQYIDVAGGNRIDALAATLDKNILNDAAQAILEDGGVFNTIVCNYEKAREISKFNTSGANPIVFVNQGSTQAGEMVQTFLSDIPVDGGLISRIVVDNKVGNDKVFLTDINRHAFVPFTNRSLRLVNTTLPGQDGTSLILRGEYTLAVKDGKQSHAVIRNLA